MPYYNYECSKGHEFEAINSIENRALSKCGKCGSIGKQTISRRPAAVHPFKYGEFEHIASEPLYIRNKQELRDACEKHECYAPGVLD